MILPLGCLCLLVHMKDASARDHNGRVVEIASGPEVNEDGIGYRVSSPWLRREFDITDIWAATRCLLPLNPPARWTEKRRTVAA